jgi:hypothetical protein
MLDRQLLPAELRAAFERQNIFLPLQPTITVIAAGRSWLITATPIDRYTLRKESGQLNVYGDLRMVGLAEPPPAPLVDIVPSDVGFGVVQIGMPQQRGVIIHNRGVGDLQVGAMRLEAEPATLPAFAVAPPAPLAIPAGGAQPLNISFEPAQSGYAYLATLAIDSNDPMTPTARVSLHGTGYAPSGIRLSRTSVSCGDWPVGFVLPAGTPATVGAAPLAIYNTGAAALTITGPSFVLRDAQGGVSPHFQLLDGAGNPVPQRPMPIRAGGTIDLRVLFRPLAVGVHEATLEIHSDDAVQPVITVPITGRGI